MRLFYGLAAVPERPILPFFLKLIPLTYVFRSICVMLSVEPVSVLRLEPFFFSLDLATFLNAHKNAFRETIAHPAKNTIPLEKTVNTWQRVPKCIKNQLNWSGDVKKRRFMYRCLCRRHHPNLY